MESATEKLKKIIKCIQEVSGEAFSVFKRKVLEEIKKENTRLKTEGEKFSSDFAGRIERGPQIQNVLLPEGTRFSWSFPFSGAHVFVVEQEPQIRTLNFSPGFFEYDRKYFQSISSGKSYPKNNRQSIRLAFPYVVFVVFIYERQPDLGYLCVFYSNKPLTSFQDKVLTVNLPNCSEGGGVCIGVRFQKDDDNLSKKAAAVINSFWGSEFSSHGMAGYRKIQESDKRFANIWEWEKHSIEDSSFVLGVKWFDEYLLGERIKRFCNAFAPGDNFDANNSENVLVPKLNKGIELFAPDYARCISNALSQILLPLSSQIVFPDSLKSELAKYLLERAEEARKNNAVFSTLKDTSPKYSFLEDFPIRSYSSYGDYNSSYKDYNPLEGYLRNY